MWKTCFSNTLNFETDGDGVENAFLRAINMLEMPYYFMWHKEYNKNLSFDMAECHIDIGKLFQERSLNVKAVISAIVPRDECWSVSRIIICKINDALPGKCSLHGICFIYQKYGWTKENEMFNLYLYFKDNVQLIGQDKLN